MAAPPYVGPSVSGAPLRDPRGRSRRDATCAGWCSSATTGPAPPTSSAPGHLQAARPDRRRAGPGGAGRRRSPPTPYRLAYFLAIRALIGEGHDQYVDDMYSSRDGKLLVVSRPSFADVVAISLETGEIVWRFVVDGVRADHMAISPDGRHVVVSASTANVVHVLRRPRRHGGRSVPVRWLTARERLHRRRQADHPRQHRHGLQPARRPAARPDQAGAALPDRRREDVRGAAHLRPAARRSTRAA